VAVGALPEPFTLTFDDDLDDLDDLDGLDPTRTAAPVDGGDSRASSAAPEVQPELIDREIGAFRSFLDGLEPSDFGR
jgi:hypothetical protein